VNANKLLPALWAFSVVLITFQAMRSTAAEGAEGFGAPTAHVGYFPLPQSFVKSSMGWLSIAAITAVSTELAIALGAGFILAQLLTMYQKGTLGKGKKPLMPGVGQPAGTNGAGAQFWGSGSGFVYDPLPIGFKRRTNNAAVGTQGATGGSSPIPTKGAVQTV
jgi:hypothetical protein